MPGVSLEHIFCPQNSFQDMRPISQRIENRKRTLTLSTGIVASKIYHLKSSKNCISIEH